MIYHYYKKEGQTMLEMLEDFRQKYQLPKDLKITYSGRLDPLATGEVIILTDKDIYQKEAYNKLDKIYNFSLLLGVATDTGDVLGLVQKPNFFSRLIGLFSFGKNLSKQNVKNTILNFRKEYVQLYPAYSSFNINGVPMWQLSKQGNLPKEKPAHLVKIYEIEVKEFSDLSLFRVYNEILKRINNIKGDFRQKEIINSWTNFYKINKKNKNFLIVKCQAKVSSGTYIRQLCIDIGLKLNMPALAYEIERHKILDENLNTDFK